MRTITVAALSGLALAVGIVLAQPAQSRAQTVPPAEPGAPMTPAPVPPSAAVSPSPNATATPTMPQTSPTP